MDSVAVTVPLRQPGKKMKKRKELDALAPPHAISRRSSGKRSSQELLTDSSDDRSEYWNVSMRNGRKCRGRRSQACPGFLKACSAFLACAPVLATASLIWLFIDVRQQLTALRSELDQVIAGSEGIPDALQKYHSLSRDLQNNQTIIFSHISDLKLQINNFTTQLSGIQHNLYQVQQWFQTAPELVNVPKNLNSLSTSVVSFGSQIQDLSATVNSLKETNVRVQDAQATMQQNISSIKHTLIELSNITQRPQMLITNETKIKTDELNTAISRLAHNLSRINENLTMTLNWTAEDEKKDHAMLVSFQDTTQDLRMKVLSLQTECAKATDLAELLNSLNKLTEQMKMMRETNTELATRIKQLEQLYSNLRNSTTMMSSVISEIRGQQQIVKVKESDDNENTTTETHNGAADTEAAQTKSSTGKPSYLTDNRKYLNFN